MKLEDMVRGNNYRYIGTPQKLVYLGKNFSGNGFWHQFALVKEPKKVWAEITDNELHLIEEIENGSRAVEITVNVPEEIKNPLVCLLCGFVSFEQRISVEPTMAVVSEILKEYQVSKKVERKLKVAHSTDVALRATVKEYNLEKDFVSALLVYGADIWLDR